MKNLNETTPPMQPHTSKPNRHGQNLWMAFQIMFICMKNVFWCQIYHNVPINTVPSLFKMMAWFKNWKSVNQYWRSLLTCICVKWFNGLNVRRQTKKYKMNKIWPVFEKDLTMMYIQNFPQDNRHERQAYRLNDTDLIKEYIQWNLSITTT